MIPKKDLQAGAIVWLDAHADSLDPKAFARSLLDYSKLNHPVLVLNTLRSDHNLIWICMVRSKDKDKHKVQWLTTAQMTSVGRFRDAYMPVLEYTSATTNASKCEECGSTHTFRKGIDRLRGDQALLYQDMYMKKDTHIKFDRVFEVSLQMLDYWDQKRRIGMVSLRHVENMAAKAITRLTPDSYALKRWPKCIKSLPCEVGAAFLGQSESWTGPLPMDLTGLVGCLDPRAIAAMMLALK